jgi:hypothetical protein
MRSHGHSTGDDEQAGRAVAVAIGAGRMLVGAAFAANPIQSMRFLGVDTATAARLQWLAQMTAARDLALGAGTVVSAITGRGSEAWLVAGAACDLADGAALTAALTRKQVSLVPATGVIAIAVAASATALFDVWRRRQTSSRS